MTLSRVSAALAVQMGGLGPRGYGWSIWFPIVVINSLYAAKDAAAYTRVGEVAEDMLHHVPPRPAGWREAHLETGAPFQPPLNPRNVIVPVRPGRGASLLPEAGAFYVMDRGYVDFERLYIFTLSAAFFVVRTKSNVLLQRR